MKAVTVDWKERLSFGGSVLVLMTSACLVWDLSQPDHRPYTITLTVLALLTGLAMCGIGAYARFAEQHAFLFGKRRRRKKRKQRPQRDDRGTRGSRQGNP
jgi:hypothetical protein